MKTFFTAPRRAALLILLGLTGFASTMIVLGACAKKVTNVDSEFIQPEGEGAGINAQMVVWYGGSTTVRAYTDNPPVGPFIDEFCGLLSPGNGDVFSDIQFYTSSEPTTVHGVIVDRTLATDYQLMRRESGGGYRPLSDFSRSPVRRWLNSQTEIYTFDDTAPATFDPPTYLGRGMVSGRITRTSPLTNTAMPHQTQVDSIAYLGVCGPTDTLFTLTWSQIPNAARYWIHIYRFSHPPGPAELLESSLPSPLNNVLPSDIFIASVEPTTPGGAPATSYKLGDASRTDVKVLQSRVINFGSVNNVRISAVDAQGQLLAMTPGNYGRITGDGEYALFRVGAAIVTPRRPGTAAGHPEGWLAFERQYGAVRLSGLKVGRLR